MIILLVLLGAGTLGAFVLSVLWSQVHPVVAIAVGVAAAVAAAKSVSRATDARTPRTGSAKRKHDQFLAAWSDAGHQADPDGPATAWLVDHSRTGVDAAEWIAHHHPGVS